MTYDLLLILQGYFVIFLISVYVFGGLLIGYLLFMNIKKIIDFIYCKKSKKTN